MTAEAPLRGRVWKFGDNISTDLLMPVAVAIGDIVDTREAALACMQANRPGWSAEVREGDVLVVGHNFACGSSRPVQRVLRSLGISIVLAESASRIFFRNCINVGYPMLVCPGVTRAFEEGDVAEIDLAAGAIRNVARGTTLHVDPLPPDSPPAQILKAGGLDAYLTKLLAAKG